MVGLCFRSIEDMDMNLDLDLAVASLPPADRNVGLEEKRNQWLAKQRTYQIVDRSATGCHFTAVQVDPDHQKRHAYTFANASRVRNVFTGQLKNHVGVCDDPPHQCRYLWFFIIKKKVTVLVTLNLTVNFISIPWRNTFNCVNG